MLGYRQWLLTQRAVLVMMDRMWLGLAAGQLTQLPKLGVLTMGTICKGMQAHVNAHLLRMPSSRR